jgi:hypothetical protein
MVAITKSALVGLAAFLATSNAAVLEARATNTALQTVFPASTGTSALAAAKTIAAGVTFDGGMKKFDRSGNTLPLTLSVCQALF